MPAIPNSYANLPSQHQEYYDRTMLERLLPNLVFMEHGQKYKKTMPKNSGDTIQFHKLNALPVPAEDLVEGVTPSGDNLSFSQYTTTVRQVGSYTLLSDLLDLMGLDPVITDATEAISDQAALTLETRVRDVVFNGTNVYYVGDRVSRDLVQAGDTLSGTDARRARQIMARNNVKAASGSEYIGFVHPDGAYDMKGSAEWMAASLYGSPEQLFNGEIGKLHNVRWIETTMCPIWEGAGAGGIDVYGSLVIGADAYGIVDISGSAKPEIIVQQLGAAGSSDPLNQRSSVGWKALMACCRLQELALLRIEHSSSLSA